jgi:hypothetical protein
LNAVVLAETEQGRGILGVVDGFSPRGVKDEGEIRWRKDFLRQIGYKLWAEPAWASHPARGGSCAFRAVRRASPNRGKKGQ